MKLHNGPVLLTICAVALGGCQLFGQTAAMDRPSALAEADMSTYFAQRLAEGRQHMMAGRAGRAITAFRQASYHPDYAAASYNGMAVAYARLGRADLAERFFLTALERDPDNAAYGRNLARLRSDPVMPAEQDAPALAGSEPVGPELPALIESAPQLRGSVSAEARDDNRLQRLSDREVRIARRAEDTAATVPPTSPARRPAVMHIATRGSASATPEANYPVRVALPSESANTRRPAGSRIRVSSPQARSASYPIRVALPPA